MDENKELHIFESSRNIFDSEEQLKASFGSGYKEYDFEPEVSGTQQQNETKAQNLWRAIETAGIVPKRPMSKSKRDSKTSSTSKGPRNWMEALKELTVKGMDKEARHAQQRTCKICDHSDLGQVFADEAYHDRYIKPCKASSCD